MTKTYRDSDGDAHVDRRTNGSWWKNVPMPIFGSVVSFLLLVIVSLVSWTWSASQERKAVAEELATQFREQAAAAVHQSDLNFRAASERMDRDEATMAQFIDLLTRHIDSDRPGR